MKVARELLEWSHLERERERKKSLFSLYHRNWQKVWASVIVNNLSAPG